MSRNMICIICPRGCAMTAENVGGEWKITGHSCLRGEEYAIRECTHPVRTVTSIVRVDNRTDTMLSIKTTQPIPKERMGEIMEIIRGMSVSAPVTIGTVLRRDVFGADIVATKTVE